MGYLEGKLEKLAEQIDQAKRRREYVYMHELMLEYHQIHNQLTERKKKHEKKMAKS